ncbi:MAG: alpha/beta hydrolase, partial [Clostridia bacterium]
ARMFTKSYCGYDVYKVKPIESVKKSDTPILFIHGDADDFIPCKMSEDMYTASRNKQSQLLKVKNAYHAGSYKTDKQLYINTVKEFVEKIEKNKEIHI